MTELVYNLVLKSAAGLALPGVLKYQISPLPVRADNAADDAEGTPQDEQVGPAAQLANVAAEQLLVSGTLVVPLLLGLAPRPVAGVAIRLLTGEPVTTYMYRPGPTTDLYLQFNALDDRHIGGGLVRINVGGARQVYSVLGTRIGV